MRDIARYTDTWPNMTFNLFYLGTGATFSVHETVFVLRCHARLHS